MHNWDYNNPFNGENEAWFIQFLSANPDETAPYEPSHQDFHCLLSYYIFIPIIEL